MRTMVPMLLAIALAGCNQPQGAHAPVSEAEATQIATAAEASFTGGKVDAIMTHYADGATMIDAAAPDPTTDRKIETGWARNFASMDPKDYAVVGRHIQLLGPDAFVSSGIERFSVAAGTARPTVSARFTDVFQRQRDGRWQIIHEHVSTPAAPSVQP